MSAFARVGSRRTWYVLLAVVVAVGAAAALLWPRGQEAAQTAESGAPERPTGPPSAEVVERSLDSALLVDVVACGKASRGTAVVFDGGVVTSAHVVAGASEVHLVSADGLSYEATVVAFDPLQDLALLEADGVEAPPLEVARPNGGDKTVILARAVDVDREPTTEGVPAEVVRTINILIPDIYGEGRQRRPGMELSTDLGPGDSGSGVVDAQGRLVGIVFSTSVRNTEVAYAVSALQLEALVESRSTGGVDLGPCR